MLSYHSSVVRFALPKAEFVEQLADQDALVISISGMDPFGLSLVAAEEAIAELERCNAAIQG